MKPDERDLLLAIARLGPHQFPFNVMGSMHPKRLEYILSKWENKGWFECGVSLRTGWLTDEGKRVARAISTQPIPTEHPA